MTLPRVRPDAIRLTQANANDLVAIATAWNRDRKARGLSAIHDRRGVKQIVTSGKAICHRRYLGETVNMHKIGLGAAGATGGVS